MKSPPLGTPEIVLLIVCTFGIIGFWHWWRGKSEDNDSAAVVADAEIVAAAAKEQAGGGEKQSKSSGGDKSKDKEGAKFDKSKAETKTKKTKKKSKGKKQKVAASKPPASHVARKTTKTGRPGVGKGGGAVKQSAARTALGAGGGFGSGGFGSGGFGSGAGSGAMALGVAGNTFAAGGMAGFDASKGFGTGASAPGFDPFSAASGQGALGGASPFDPTFGGSNGAFAPNNTPFGGISGGGGGGGAQIGSDSLGGGITGGSGNFGNMDLSAGFAGMGGGQSFGGAALTASSSAFAQGLGAGMDVQPLLQAPASQMSESGMQQLIPGQGNSWSSMQRGQTQGTNWSQGAMQQHQQQHSAFSQGANWSQQSSMQEMPPVYRSCQATVELWKFIEVPSNRVVRTELLGRGAFAEVFRGQSSGFECAIKLYRKSATKKHREEAMREIKLAASLDHPCTLRVLGWVRQPLQTIMELCLGDLKGFYGDRIEGFSFTESEALRLLKVCYGC